MGVLNSERRRKIAAVGIGDIVRGEKRNGRPLLLLVYDADDAVIRTRRVTTGEKIDFDRDGRSLPYSAMNGSTITSTARLPSRDHQVAVGLDHKMRSAKALTDLGLSEAEIDLLLTIEAFFAADRLPEQ